MNRSVIVGAILGFAAGAGAFFALWRAARPRVAHTMADTLAQTVAQTIATTGLTLPGGARDFLRAPVEDALLRELP